MELSLKKLLAIFVFGLVLGAGITALTAYAVLQASIPIAYNQSFAFGRLVGITHTNCTISNGIRWCNIPENLTNVTRGNS